MLCLLNVPPALDLCNIVGTHSDASILGPQYMCCNPLGRIPLAETSDDAALSVVLRGRVRSWFIEMSNLPPSSRNNTSRKRLQMTFGLHVCPALKLVCSIMPLFSPFGCVLRIDAT